MCRARFTTYEHVEERPLRVAKRDGSGQDFDRTKLLRSVASACAKRPVTEADIDAVVDAVEGVCALDPALTERGMEISCAYYASDEEKGEGASSAASRIGGA